MVEELKAEMRKLENLIGFEGKVDVTSRAFTQELIRALDSKYKNDVKNSLRLHQLEFYHDLIESACHQQRKNVEVEEKFLLQEKKKDEDDEEEVEKPAKEKELFKKPEDVVAIKAGNIDEWKDLMTLSRIYYVFEHPNSTGLTWKRRIFKKKAISKFSDKDLIEWRVAENFKLRGLEEWALSRSEARKVAEKSPYDFDDLLEDDESRELEDMFNILNTQKQKKRKLGQLEKSLKSNRPFKFKDEGVEDWTESYSDDSEESGVIDISEEILEIDEEPDFKLDDYKVSSEETSINEEETKSEIFSIYEEKPKFRNPVFEEMEKAETMGRWFDLCHEAIGGPNVEISERPPIPQILFPIEEGEDEEDLAAEIPDNIGYKRGQTIEAKEKDIERLGGRIPVKEVREEDVERPGDDSEEPPILVPYKREKMRIKEAGEKDFERPGGRIPAKEAKEKDIEKLAGKVPEPGAKDVDVGKTEHDVEDQILKGTRISQKAVIGSDVENLPEKIPGKEAKETNIETKEDFEKRPPLESIDKIFDDMDALDDDIDLYDADEQVTSSEIGSISKHDEEVIERQTKKMTEEGKAAYALSDVEKEEINLTPDKISALSSERQATEQKPTTSFERQATKKKSATPLEKHATTKKKSVSTPEIPITDEQVTSSEIGSISKHDEGVIERQIKKMTEEGKAAYALSDAENEAIYLTPDKVSALSSERQATEQKPTTSFERQATKKKSATHHDKYATKKKSVTTTEIPATKKKSVTSSDKATTKKKSTTSSDRAITKKKSTTSSDRATTKKKSTTSFEKQVVAKKSTSSERQKNKQDTNTSDKKISKTPSIHQATFSIQDEKRVRESLKSIIEEGKVDASEGKEKEYKIRRATLLPDDSNTRLPDLESILKSESSLNVIKSGLDESILDDTSDKKITKKPSIYQATFSMQEKKRVGERLKSIVEEGKVDALEEKEKEYKIRRATLVPDDSNTRDSDLESILKSESNLNIMKSGKESPNFNKSQAEVGTIGLVQEDNVEKVVKSLVNEAKPTALSRKDPSPRERKGSRDSFRKSK